MNATTENIGCSPGAATILLIFTDFFQVSERDRPFGIEPCFEQDQRLVGGSWQGIPNGACTPIDGLILVNPGATDSLVAELISAPGTYRVGINYTSDSSFSAPAKVSFSNRFTFKE